MPGPGRCQRHSPRPTTLPTSSHRLTKSTLQDFKPYGDRLEHRYARRENCRRPPNRAAREAEEAVRTLLLWAGDNPEREGLGHAGAGGARLRGFFAGYADDPVALLQRTFEETDGYDEMVVLRDIRFESHCEHHLVPIIGRAHVAYLPRSRVVGISKLARLVEAFASRSRSRRS